MDILFTAFLLSVVLVGIHSFLGMEILKRGIIFTDLAIGQMAALGAAFALFFLEGKFLYPTSLLFAFSGAFLISVASKVERLSEAFIGLVYAFGIATVYLFDLPTGYTLVSLHSVLAASAFLLRGMSIKKVG